MSANKIAYNVWTEFSLSSYVSFHDFEWARNSAPDFTGTVVDEAFTHLMLRWFHISEHFRFPELMMLALKGAYQSTLESKPIPDGFMMALKQRLMRDFCGSLTVTKGQELMKLLTDVEKELSELDWKVEDNFNTQQAFEGMVRENEGYAVGLGHSIGQSFCSIYFSYEHFIKRCFQLLGGDKNQRVNNKFHDLFKARLKDDALYEYVWTCDEVRFARDIRSSIVHSDGELEPTDMEYAAYHHTHDRRIMIHTDGVTYLYKSLRDRAVKLAPQINAIAGAKP